MKRFGMQSLNPLSWKREIVQFPETPMPEMLTQLSEARRRALLLLLIGLISLCGFLGLAQYYRVTMKEVQRWNGDAGELLLLLGQARTQLESPLIFDELFYRRLGTIAGRIDKLVVAQPANGTPAKDSASAPQKAAAEKSASIPGETRKIRTRADDVSDMLKAIVSEEKQFNRMAQAIQQDRRFLEAMSGNAADSSILSQAARRAQALNRESSSANPGLKLSLDYQPGLDYAWLRVAFNDRKTAAEEMTRELEEGRVSPQRRLEIERDKRLLAFQHAGDFVTTLDVFHTQRMQVLKLTENLPALSHAAANPGEQGDSEPSMLAGLFFLLLLSFGTLFAGASLQLNANRRATSAVKNLSNLGRIVQPATPVHSEPIAAEPSAEAVAATAARGSLMDLVGQSGLTADAFLKSVEELADAVADYQSSQRSANTQLRNAYLAGVAQFEQDLAAVSNQGINLAMALANQGDPAAMLETCDDLNASIQALDAQLSSFLQGQAQRIETGVPRNIGQIDDSRNKLQLLASRLRQQLEGIATQLQSQAEAKPAGNRRAVSANESKDVTAAEYRVLNGK